MLEKGKKAPDFTLKSSDGKEVKLSDYSGKKVILYFYPKDNTAGCTKEAVEFSDLIKKFEDKNTVIIGISPDSIVSHKKFEEKHNLKITLLSDPDKKVLKEYGVWQMKKRCGKESMGVVRSTYIIDEHRSISDVFEKVKAGGHAQQVMDCLCSCNKSSNDC